MEVSTVSEGKGKGVINGGFIFSEGSANGGEELSEGGGGDL
jgi:hypothetical protein